MSGRTLGHDLTEELSEAVVGGSGGAALLISRNERGNSWNGLYGGVNVDGTVISVDGGRNHAYYGRAATPVDILVSHSISTPYARTLAQAAPGATNGN